MRAQIHCELNFNCAGVECQMVCVQNPPCKVFQFNKFTNKCELKSGSGSSISDTNTFNGPPVCGYIACKFHYTL